MCPQRAIEVVEVEKGGEMIRFPHVLTESCIGCGLCEFICPTEGEAAIRVFAPVDSINHGGSIKI
jgi:formate hydrogenlyase subunit 6/NADH:ubiquinone oxidoreductase subunit I